MIDPFTGEPFAAEEKALTEKDKVSLLDDKDFLSELRSLLGVPSGSSGGGSLASYTTDDLVEGVNNHYGTWEHLTSSLGTELTYPRYDRKLLAGPSDGAGIDELEAIIGTDYQALFIGTGTSGANYFTNTSYGTGFLAIGGIFVSGAARGAAGAETALMSGDYIGSHSIIAYDGSDWTLNVSGDDILPSMYFQAASTPAADAYDTDLFFGGLLTPYFTIQMRNSSQKAIVVNEDAADIDFTINGDTADIIATDAAIDGIGFYGATPVAQQTGVAVTAAGIHAALVSLGLITA